jgi:hypothetical protein
VITAPATSISLAEMSSRVLTSLAWAQSLATTVLHSEMDGRPGQKLTGEFTVEESLRRVIRDILTTRHKEDIWAFFLVFPSGQEHKFPMVEWDIVTFEMVGEVETGIWTYLLHPANSTLATVLALIQSAGPPAKGYSTVQQPGPGATPPVQ